MKPFRLPPWVHAFGLGILGIALLIAAVGGGFLLASPRKLDTPSLASFIDASQTLFYVRNTSIEVSAVLDTISQFTSLPAIPANFLPTDNTPFELALVQNGWILRTMDTSGTGSVRFSSDDAQSVWIQEGDGGTHPFLASPLVSATLSANEPNAVILMMNGSSLVSSGSLLHKFPIKPLALTSTWGPNGGVVTLWKEESSFRMPSRNVHSIATSTPFSLLLTEPEKTWMTVTDTFNILSPGLMNGLQGILDYQLRDITNQHVTLQDLSSFGTNPILLLFGNSGSSLSFAIGGSPADDVLVKFWSGALLHASKGTVRTTQLPREQIHRDIVESVKTTEKDENGWHVKAVHDSSSPFFIASRANHALITNTDILLSPALQLLSTLSMVSSTIVGSFDTMWIHDHIKRYVPFLLDDPFIGPLVSLFPFSSRVDFSVQNDRTSMSFVWQNTLLIQD